MATFEELVKQKIEILENSPERFSSSVEKAQLKLWNEIEKQFDKLQTKGGKVVQNSKNLALINTIVKRLGVLISTGDYIKAVQSFLGEYDQSAKISTGLVKTLDKAFVPNAFAKQIQTLYREAAIDQLFTNPSSNTQTSLRANLISSISSGATFAQTVNSAREIVQGGPDTDGRMLANIKTVAITSIAVSDAGYSAAINNQIGAEWFRYVGGTIETTRPFCQQRNGKYYHRKEIEAWGAGKESGGAGAINDEGKWYGQIEGTTASTIFTNRGGWNCRHFIVAVPISSVPPEVIQRAIDEGFFKAD